MRKLAEITAMAAPLARAAANEEVEHRELLAAAEGIIREIEEAFHVGGYLVAEIDGRKYTRVPGRERVYVEFAWLVDGQVILDAPGRYLALEVRLLDGADPFIAVEETNKGISPLASRQQLKTFANDLPRILESFVQDYPRRQLVGELAAVVMALRQAYHEVGVVLDWPKAGTTTRFADAERAYRVRLHRQGREVRGHDSPHEPESDEGPPSP